MLFIKCKCGSVFTVEDRSLEKERIYCPNCENAFTPCGVMRLSKFYENLAAAGFQLRMIPDDAKIRVTFDA